VTQSRLFQWKLRYVSKEAICRLSPLFPFLAFLPAVQTGPEVDFLKESLHFGHDYHSEKELMGYKHSVGSTSEDRDEGQEEVE